MEYAIRHVFDADTGVMYDASIVLGTISQGQQFRKDYHLNSQELRCNECHQKATVSNNKSGRVYFRHFPNTSYCALKDDTLTVTDRKQIEEYIASKESNRHKSLKKSIRDYLLTQDGVDPQSITVDDRFLTDEKEKRRPDISCQFKDKSLVFEIQISPLPAKYIFKRHDFYQRNQVYLIWILDDFNVRGQTQTEKDIKYLSRHQNFFYFNDNGSKHTIVAQFKAGHVNSENKVYTEWTHEFISLADLKFDSNEYQVYYRSLLDEKVNAENLKIERELSTVINLLREFFKSDNERYIPIIEKELEEIDYHSFQILNNKIGGVKDSELFFKSLTGEGKPNFIFFLLNSIRFAKNLNSKNKEGVNLLQYVLQSRFNFRHRLTLQLFSNGYSLSISDREYLRKSLIPGETLPERQQRILRILAYDILGDFDLIELFNRLEGSMLTILSAKHRRIIGMGFPNFVALANNAIQHYQEVWLSIERAFRFYGIWEDVLTSDRKGSFHKKLNEFNSSSQDKNSDRAHLILDRLFPELSDSSQTISQLWPKSIEELEPPPLVE